MPSTYTPIASTTLGSDTATVTLSGIVGTYTDLVVVATTRGSSDTESDIYIRFNSDSGTNYSYTRMYGQYTNSVGSDRGSNQNYIVIGRQGGSVFAPNIYHIMNYANTTTFKTVVARSGHGTTGSALTLANVGLWRSTAAITSVSFVQGGAQSYKAGSTFTLYGIKAA